MVRLTRGQALLGAGGGAILSALGKRGTGGRSVFATLGKIGAEGGAVLRSISSHKLSICNKV